MKCLKKKKIRVDEKIKRRQILKQKRLKRFRWFEFEQGGKDTLGIEYENVKRNNIAEIWATVYFEETQNVLFIEFLKVCKTFRKQNLGSIILKDLISSAIKKYNVRSVQLESKIPAIGFYRKHGFRYVDRKQIFKVKNGEMPNMIKFL